MIESRSMENHVNDRSNAYQYNYRSESLNPLRMVKPIDKPTKFHLSRTSYSSTTSNQSLLLDNNQQKGILKRTEELPINLDLVDKIEWNYMTTFSLKEKDKKLDSLTTNSKNFTQKVSNELSTINYIGPLNKEKLYIKTIRKIKSEGKFVPLSKIINPAAVYIQDKSLSVNQNALEKSKKYTTQHHSGLWELNKTENK